MNYYNEFDSYAAEWLRNLIGDGAIPPGHVDTRSITEVTAEFIHSVMEAGHETGR